MQSTSNFQLDRLLQNHNGYPADFKVVNVINDSQDRRYFPATLTHIVTIRNLTDEELAQSVASYHAFFEEPANLSKSATVRQLIAALIIVGEDEQARREAFRMGHITMEDYFPDIYEGNVPRVTIFK